MNCNRSTFQVQIVLLKSLMSLRLPRTLLHDKPHTPDKTFSVIMSYV